MTFSSRALSGFGLTGGVLFFALSHGCAESEPIDLSDLYSGGQGGSSTVPSGQGGAAPSTFGGAPSVSGGSSNTSTGGRAGKGSGGSVSKGGTSGTSGGSGGKATTGGRSSTSTGGKSSTSTGGRSSTSTGGKGGTTSAGAGGRSSGGSAGRASAGGSAGRASGGGAGKSSSGECDFDSSACASMQCDAACPSGMGTYCVDTCEAIIDCLEKNPTCGTAADPMCVLRNNGAPNKCTTEWESASGGSSPPGAPAKAAQDLRDCACGD